MKKECVKIIYLKNKGVIKLSTNAAIKNNGKTNHPKNNNTFLKSHHILIVFQFHIFLTNKTVILKDKANDSNTALISKIQCGKIANKLW
jgi:hypothetical protein